MTRSFFPVTLLLLAAATPATPQESKPAAAAEPPASSSPAQPAPRLNLRLDNPSSYAREAPREEAKDASGTLPTLGGGTSLDRPPPPPPKWGGTGPVEK